MRPRTAFLITVYLVGSAALPSSTSAQGNYEIQVYAYETVEPHHTMVELHSNFTFEGSKSTNDGTLPTNHQLHETLEITHGFSDWFETGFLYFHFGEDRPGLGLRRQPHSTPRARSAEVALAGRRQPFERNRLAEPPLFGGYLDVGDPPHRG
jgi:hypothetical protein